MGFEEYYKGVSVLWRCLCVAHGCSNDFPHSETELMNYKVDIVNRVNCIMTLKYDIFGGFLL